MARKKIDLAIINRSFWPVYPVIGEALLQFAERSAAEGKSVSVIMQDHAGIHASLDETGRGKGVNFLPCKALTTSASDVFLRIIDAFFFMFWVGFSLIRLRPKKVYVSTDPPILVPYIVMIYAKAFNAEYVYHLQDIHPEATNVVFPVNKLVFSFARWLDSSVVRNAKTIITLTQQMADEVMKRTDDKLPIYLLDNPAVSFETIIQDNKKRKGFSFGGNAGRLQRIPLLIQAITEYYKEGGGLEFVFAGGGVFAKELTSLSTKFPGKVKYLGQVTAEKAAQLNADFEWALLPIEDEVTKFAFPSKSSTYVFSGALVLAICGENTSVASWVKTNRIGISCKPAIDDLVSCFHKIERNELDLSTMDCDREALKEKLHFDSFVTRLQSLVFA